MSQSPQDAAGQIDAAASSQGGQPMAPSPLLGVRKNAMSQATLDRIMLLQQSGYGHFDPQIQATYAGAPVSNTQMLDMAGATARALNNPSRNLSGLFSDPVLHKSVSLGLALHQYLTDNLGPYPVAQPDLSAIQQNLQAQGYAKGLESNGVWTPAWANEWNNAYFQHEQQVIQGKHALSVQAGRGARGFLSAFLPSHLLPSLVHAVTSIPSDLRMLAGDIASGLYKTVHPVQAFSNGAPRQQLDVAASHLSGSVQRGLGGQVSDQQAGSDKIGHLVNDLSTLFLFSGLTKAGGALADAAGSAWKAGVTTDLGKAAAVRGPGVIANSLYRVSTPVLDDNGMPLIVDGKPVYQAVETPTGLLTTRPFQSMPILRQAVPLVGKLTDGDGMYYRFRTFAAQPMRIQGVNTAVRVGNTVQLTGAAVKGAAMLQQYLGGGNEPFAKSVNASHPINGIGGTILDVLSGVGRPIGVSASAHVGDMVGALDQASNHALGPTGVISAFERGTGLDYDQLVAENGQTAIDHFLNSKLNQFAAASYARDQLAKSNLTMDSEAYRQAFQQASHQAWTDPRILTASRDKLVQNQAELWKSFAADALSITGNPAQEYSHGLPTLLQAWRAANDLFTHHAQQLVTPAAAAELEARAAIPLASDAQTAVTATDVNRGSLGIANKAAKDDQGNIVGGTVTSQEAHKTVQQLAEQLREAGSPKANSLFKRLGLVRPVDSFGQIPKQPDYAQLNEVRKSAAGFLVNVLHIHPMEVSSLSTENMLVKIEQSARQLASEVYLPAQAAPEMTARYQKLADLGYRPVHGTDIGHAFTTPLIDPTVIDGREAWARKVASKLGVNTEHFATRDPGWIARNTAARNIDQLAADGKIHLPPGYNGQRLLYHIESNLPNDIKLGERTTFNLFRRLFKAQAETLVRAGKAQDTQGAYDLIQREITQGNGLRDVSGPTFVKATMTSPPEVSNLLRDEGVDAPFISEGEARLVHHTVLHAYAARPAAMMGLSKAEDMFRASLGFMGKAAPDSRIVQRISLLPNDLLRARDRYRFRLDPLFNARRVVKTMLKMGLEGVPLTARPYESMVKAGTLHAATKTLDQVYPEDRTAGMGYDAMDKLLWQSSIDGIYNPRHFMAYTADWLKSQGLSNSEIRAKLDHVFTYGDRTALERTMGTIWYPFSFQKTLYRNVGGYLLDHAGQRLALYAALQAYQALDQHDHIGQWLNDHLPVLQELQKLNGFQEGIGPGEFGGINAPLLNAFLPQRTVMGSSPDQNQRAISAVTAAIPVLKDLNSLLLGYSTTSGKRGTGELQDQLGVTYWGARNAMDDVTRWIGNGVGGKNGWWIFDGLRSPLDPQHPALDRAAQLRNAYQLKNALVAKMASLIDYNYHHASAPIKFPDNTNVPVPLRGLTVDRTSIEQLVALFYPDYNPAEAAATAVTLKEQEQQALQRLQASDPARYEAYSTFGKYADKVSQYNLKGSYSTAELQQITARFRQVATNLTEADPQFLAWYGKYWQYTFGPLVELNR